MKRIALKSLGILLFIVIYDVIWLLPLFVTYMHSWQLFLVGFLYSSIGMHMAIKFYKWFKDYLNID